MSMFFEHVIIKLDKDGCLLKNPSGTYYINPLANVQAVDSTGAGDAFLSGFLFGLFEDYPIEKCIQFGNVTGGVCVQGVGCLSRYVDRETLLQLADEIPIHV